MFAQKRVFVTALHCLQTVTHVSFVFEVHTPSVVFSLNYFGSIKRIKRKQNTALPNDNEEVHEVINLVGSDFLLHHQPFLIKYVKKKKS